MSNIFVVEHLIKGHPTFDTIRGVEDISLDLFKDIQTMWVCDNEMEVEAVENELRRKHSKQHEEECGK
jgi:hypothetical protein